MDELADGTKAILRVGPAVPGAAAAGALGLAKVLVAAKHAAVPASLHLNERSDEINWEGQGLRPVCTLTPWPAVNGQRLAAVSAFGMSGTNAHVIVSMPDGSPGEMVA